MSSLVGRLSWEFVCCFISLSHHFIHSEVIILTGALHFAYNSAGSFLIEGLKTNPTLAVILVAVALLVMGLLTILYPMYFLFFKRESFVNSNWFFTLWYFILSCLTFFIAGVLGLIVGTLCFITAVCLLIAIIILKFPNNSSMQKIDEIEVQPDSKSSNKTTESMTSQEK